MRRRRIVPRHLAAIAAAAFAGAFLSPAAHAADIGECAAPDAMTARLKAEDQHSIVSAQLITEAKQVFGLIVTISGDSKTGYILKADQPLGDRAGQFCVYNRLATIRLFDARIPGVNPATLLKSPEADAQRRCAVLEDSGKVWKGGCVPLNAAIRRAEAAGWRVVLQGLTVAKTAAGRYEPDAP